MWRDLAWSSIQRCTCSRKASLTSSSSIQSSATVATSHRPATRMSDLAAAPGRETSAAFQLRIKCWDCKSRPALEVRRCLSSPQASLKSHRLSLNWPRHPAPITARSERRSSAQSSRSRIQSKQARCQRLVLAQIVTNSEILARKESSEIAFLDQ